MRYRLNGKTLHDSTTKCDDAHLEGLIGITWADAKALLVADEVECCLHCFRDEVADDLTLLIERSVVLPDGYWSELQRSGELLTAGSDVVVNVRPEPLYGIGETFRELAGRWHDETDHLSSPRQIASHPAYLEIIALGRAALPYILADLRDNGGEWYLALRAITGASPVTPEMSTSTARVTEAWLNWGRARNGQYVTQRKVTADEKATLYNAAGFDLSVGVRKGSE